MTESPNDLYGGRTRPFGETDGASSERETRGAYGVSGVRSSRARSKSPASTQDLFRYTGPVPTGGPAPGFISTVMPRSLVGYSTGSDGFCVASAVLGILSLPLFPLVLFGLLAVVFGHLGYHRVRKEHASRGGIGGAIIGMVCGYLSFIPWALLLLR